MHGSGTVGAAASGGDPRLTSTTVAHSIFNVFSASDPIGTRLNSTVDATYAKSLRSVPLVRATKSILRTLPETLEPQAPSAGLFSTWGRSATPTASPAKDPSATVPSDDAPDGAEALFGKPDGEEKKTNAAAALGKRAKSGFEEKWKEIKAERENKKSEDRKQAQEAEEQGQVERNRAQRRMAALCELGCVGEWPQRSRAWVREECRRPCFARRLCHSASDVDSDKPVHGVSLVPCR